MMNVAQTWMPHFFGEMCNLFQHHQLLDVHLTTRNSERISAHRMVLAASSPYFRVMFCGPFVEATAQEIHLHEIDGPILRQVVDYCYTGHIDLTAQNLESILTAANLFQMDQLKAICSARLLEYLEADNCLGIYLFAETQGLSDLLKKSRHFILENFSEICVHTEFKFLEMNRLMELLQSDELNVDSEETIFNALMRWIDHNPSERKHLLPELLPLVRLEQISSQFLVERVQPIVLEAKCETLLKQAHEWLMQPDKQLATERYSYNKHWLVAYGANDDQSAPIELFSARTQQWHTVETEGIVDKDSRTIFLQNRLFVIGGGRSASDVMLSFDFKLRKWTDLCRLNIARKSHSVAAMNGVLYAVGGVDCDDNVTNSVERYDPASNTWTVIAGMVVRRAEASIAVLDGKLYVVGGAYAYSFPYYCCSSMECYDIETNKWRLCDKPMAKNRAAAGVAVVNGSLYILGGFNTFSQLGSKRYEEHDTVERYDPQANAWTNVTSISNERTHVSIVTFLNKIFVAGRCRADAEESMESYDVKTDSWVSMKTLTETS